MKISAKARYAIASVIYMAQTYETKECVALVNLADHLKISKIYLEHIFSLLKRAKLVKSIKGAQGGYLLSKAPHEITAYDVMIAIETSLFARSESTVQESAPNIEKVMQNNVFAPLDKSVHKVLSEMTLAYLIEEMEKHNDNYMYYL